MSRLDDRLRGLRGLGRTLAAVILGPQAAALVFGIVAINELLAPVAFRIALLRSGEAGQLQRGDDNSSIVPEEIAPPATQPPQRP